MSTPRISVVMAVHNGVADLARTVDSILAQDFADFEFIIVDDGSTDGTASELARHAKADARIRVLSLERNAGLTAALIEGCALARGEFIARQDCGDVSRPGRLRRQLEAVRGATLCGTHVLVSAPEGEALYVSECGAAPGGRMTIPHHGSALFPRALCERVGGYRREFRFAQDVDLWLRLSDRGPIAVVPETLYESRVSREGISSRARALQVEFARLAADAAGARAAGRDEAAVLRRAAELSAKRAPRLRGDTGATDYFVSRCLAQNGDPNAREYALLAWRRSPANPKFLANAAIQALAHRRSP